MQNEFALAHELHMTRARLRDEMSAEEYLLWPEHFRLEAKRVKDEEKRQRG